MRLARSGDIIERSMIVMTDGLHNTGLEPEPIAINLAAQGIVIHTITFGSDADKPRMSAWQRSVVVNSTTRIQASSSTKSSVNSH